MTAAAEGQLDKSPEQRLRDIELRMAQPRANWSLILQGVGLLMNGFFIFLSVMGVAGWVFTRLNIESQAPLIARVTSLDTVVANLSDRLNSRQTELTKIAVETGRTVDRVETVERTVTDAVRRAEDQGSEVQANTSNLAISVSEASLVAREVETQLIALEDRMSQISNAQQGAIAELRAKVFDTQLVPPVPLDLRGIARQRINK